MKVFIAGGNGLVGRHLAEQLLMKNHEVAALGRSIRKDQVPEGTEIISADASQPGIWQDEVIKYDAVVNLAGATIFNRWSSSYKKKIINSRVGTTRQLIEALKNTDSNVRVLVNASAVGYYGFTGEEEVTESAPAGEGFLADVARIWEEEAEKVEDTGTRVVLARFGVVLSSHGGALEKLKKIFNYRLGSVLGNGEQWFSWIHQVDLSEILIRLIEDENLSGPVNCTAPKPVTNRSLTGKLSGVLDKPVLLPPVPAWVLRMILGEFSTLLLQGQRAVPEKLIEAGYEFHYPGLTPALQDLLFK